MDTTTNFSIRFKRDELAEIKKICKDVNNSNLTTVLRTYIEFHKRYPKSYKKFQNRLRNDCTAPVNTTDTDCTAPITKEEQSLIDAYKKLKKDNIIIDVGIYDLTNVEENRPKSLSEQDAQIVLKTLIKKGVFTLEDPYTII